MKNRQDLSVGIYQKYKEEKPPVTLVGIYKISTKEIFLAPCIPQRIHIFVDSENSLISGYHIEQGFNGKKEMGRLLTNKELMKYSDLMAKGYIPRFKSRYTEDEALTSHELLLEKYNLINFPLLTLKDEEQLMDYRGFSVTLTEPPTFEWKSYSVNVIGENDDPIVGQELRETIRSEFRSIIAKAKEATIRETEQKIIQQFSNILNMIDDKQGNAKTTGAKLIYNEIRSFIQKKEYNQQRIEKLIIFIKDTLKDRTTPGKISYFETRSNETAQLYKEILSFIDDIIDKQEISDSKFIEKKSQHRR